MALNLVRNSKVFFTNNVNANTGVVNASTVGAFTASNTFELQVLDGFTFSQTVNNETVTLSESGTAPARGQRSFNTSLAPVDFSFSTYIRPKNATTKITSEESILWNALMSDTAIGTPVSLGAVTGVTATSAGVVTIAGSAITGALPTVGDVIVLSGVATTTPTGNSPLTHDRMINGAGTVLTAATTGITVQLFNFPTVAITATTLTTASTIKYSKFAWNESNASYSQLSSGVSEKNQLQKFGMLFLVDNVLYAVDNCALNQVTIDFGLDSIATAQWSGQATALRQFSTGVSVASAGSFSGGAAADVGAAGAYLTKVTDAAYITNKLSTVNLSAVKAIGTSITAGDSYTVPVTGGSITINNNITYITPANLGVVNAPVTYYTGTRSVTGTLTAYLRTGTTKETGELLADLLAEAATNIEPMFALAIWVGGSGSTVKVALDMPAVSMGIPSIDVQQVVSTSMNFTAQGVAPGATTFFDITKPTDIAVRYYA